MQNKYYYPVYLDLKYKKCLVVGGGAVALRKVRSLLDCHARVKLVGKNIIPGIKRLKIKYTNLNCYERSYKPKDLKDVILVITATNNNKLNARIAEDAFKKRLLINSVDNRDLCSFIAPSVVRRGDLSISISTGGVSCALAKMIRIDLEKRFGNEYKEFLEIIKKVRPGILKLPYARKKNIWKKIVTREMVELVRKKNKKEAAELMHKIIKGGE